MRHRYLTLRVGQFAVSRSLNDVLACSYVVGMDDTNHYIRRQFLIPRRKIVIDAKEGCCFSTIVETDWCHQLPMCHGCGNRYLCTYWRTQGEDAQTQVVIEEVHECNRKRPEWWFLLTQLQHFRKLPPSSDLVWVFWMIVSHMEYDGGCRVAMRGWQG